MNYDRNGCLKKKKKKKSDPSSQFNWPPLGNLNDLEKFI